MSDHRCAWVFFDEGGGLFGFDGGGRNFWSDGGGRGGSVPKIFGGGQTKNFRRAQRAENFFDFASKQTWPLKYC